MSVYVLTFPYIQAAGWSRPCRAPADRYAGTQDTSHSHCNHNMTKNGVCQGIGSCTSQQANWNRGTMDFKDSVMGFIDLLVRVWGRQVNGAIRFDCVGYVL